VRPPHDVPDDIDQESEDDAFLLGGADEQDFDDGLGPDERDRDLMDGTWEQRHYAGHHRQRDWRTIYLGISLLVLLGLVVPSILVLVQ